MMFVGEEILHSARMWTHGYDIFSPDENLVSTQRTSPPHCEGTPVKKLLL